jgi:hypothetical protein
VSERSIDELADAIRRRLDATEQWALEVSRNERGEVTPGGEHWQWVCDEHDVVATPQPGVDELLETDECGNGCYRFSLRSVETYVDTDSMYPSPLPHFVLTTEEVPSVVAGYLLRFPPARVLADVARDRNMLARLLAEPHGRECDNVAYDDPCECRRDERVLGYLELLAGVDEA